MNPNRDNQFRGKTLCACLLAAGILSLSQLHAELPTFNGGGSLLSTECTDPAIANIDRIPTGRHWEQFLVKIWQYKTDAARDLDLYRDGGFKGFHIDRGKGKEEQVKFAVEKNLPYYVDHLAGKGTLHLTERTGVGEVMRKRELVERPQSLAKEETIEFLKSEISSNIAPTMKGPVVAYSLDDEISLASFNTPAEVDSSPDSVAGYRKWLEHKYGSIDALNKSWGTSYSTFTAAEPVSFESIRKVHSAGPFANWRLAPWMDWRSYMDSQFARTLGGLCRFTNSIDPNTPCGFVGGQTPSAYGGFDYEKICRSVQFIESYDIGGTNEILRSFWNGSERRPYVQTWFSTGNMKRDSWFLWYYLVHGNRGMIAWPDTGGGGGLWFQNGEGLLPHLKQLAPTTKEVQGKISRHFLSEESRFDPDPVAVYYSMPSVRASWVTDVIPHGGTWPNRSSSLDNRCQSAAKNRVAWFKLLEDCGFQYNVVSAPQLVSDQLIENGYRVLILNRAMCLSDDEISALERFSSVGGTIIADHWTGVLDENGNGRPLPNELDPLFDISRKPVTGYFGGNHLCELNGEKYKEPYLNRLQYEQAERENGIVRVGEIEELPNRGNGSTYLDRSILEYFDNDWRSGPRGQSWRTLMSDILSNSGLTAKTEVWKDGQRLSNAEILHWRTGNRKILAIVMNPVREGSISSAGEITGVESHPFEVEIRFSSPQTGIRNLRDGSSFPDGTMIMVEWNPWEALVIGTD